MPPQLHFLTQICTKSFVSWGFAPDPNGGGAYSTPHAVALPGFVTRRGKAGNWIMGHSRQTSGSM